MRIECVQHLNTLTSTLLERHPERVGRHAPLPMLLLASSVTGGKMLSFASQGLRLHRIRLSTHSVNRPYNEARRFGAAPASSRSMQRRSGPRSVGSNHGPRSASLPASSLPSGRLSRDVLSDAYAYPVLDDYDIAAGDQMVVNTDFD